jgi:hypothetical protein
VSSANDVRDTKVGDALGTVAGSDDPPYDRLLERVHRRGRIRQTERWTAILAAVAVFVGGVTWAGLSIAGHESVPATSKQWKLANVPQIGLAMRYPANWHKERIQGGCILDPVGLLVANIPGPYGSTRTSDGCRWPPGMGRLPSNAVIVAIDRYRGGPPTGPVDPTAAPSPPFPLSLSRFHRVDGPARSAFSLALSFRGDHRYQVFAWIGNDASAADRAAARRVVASIAPSRCTAPSPGLYDPGISPGSGSSGSVFHVTGEVPTVAEDGTYVGPTGSVAVFWNVDPSEENSVLGSAQMSDLLAGRTPSQGPGAARFLGAERVEGMCQYDLEVAVPDSPPGAYNLAVFQYGDGSASALKGVQFTVTQPDSGIAGTFFVARTHGSIPSPFPTAPPWRGAEGEVAPGLGTLAIGSPNGGTTTVSVNGEFRVLLAPGHYSVVGVTGDGSLGKWGPNEVVVRRHAFTSITVVVIGSESP